MSRMCFVIMPLGGDEQRRRHFRGVYESIIVPAAQRSGYTPKRSDLGGGPGNISAKIIQDLLDAEIVIADLTDGEANVLFELGIRHVFRKSGTVHIVDAANRSPFDIRQYRAVRYTSDLADIPGVINEIVEAIKQREERVGLSDNPVHDTVPSLPNSIREIGQSDQNKRIAELQAALERLEADNDLLKSRITELDPSGVLDSIPSEITVDNLLDDADDIMKSTGEYVMLRLTERASEEGRDGFLAELRKALKSPYLTANDFLGLSRMCTTLGLQAHRQAVLEIAHNRYPHNAQITLALIDAYDDSPNPATKERGRLMVEDLLHVQRESNQLPRLGDISSWVGTYEPGLGLLFNFYFSDGKPEWVLSVTDSALEEGLDNEVIRRNRARALQRMGRLNDADIAYRQSVDRFPSDSQSLQWYGDFLDDQRRFKEAYLYSEQGVIVAPSEPTAYINHAIQILNRGYARTASGEIEGPVTNIDALAYCVPLFLEAIMRSGNSAAVREDIANILVRRDATREAQALREGAEPPGREDRSALDYILERAGSSSEREF